MSTDADHDADEAVKKFISENDLLVECQGELKVAEAQVEHLQTALVSARRIGAAIGILMGQHKVTDDDAFELLRRASQARNRKIRDLADQVVLTGTLDI
jgi:AmiR/NasT family two-component response regulator